MTALPEERPEDPSAAHAGDPSAVAREVPRRRPPTALEAKALAHPLRQRIVRQCGTREMTNKELADHLGVPPGTALHHVRLLVRAGLLEPVDVRTGTGGALERPYRATGATWWLDDPLGGTAPDVRFGPVAAALDDALAAGPDAVSTSAAFRLHLSDDDVAELDRRILAVLDEYVATDDDRLDRPLHRGLFVLHRPVP
jgi:DNA-binding transcriptional ArsR family regulator